MPLITFLPSGRTTDVSPGTLLSDAARAAGVSIIYPCGCKGVCGRCIVRIISGETDAAAGFRYEINEKKLVPACRTRAADTPLTVEIVSGLESEEGQFTGFSKQGIEETKRRSRYCSDMQSVEEGLKPAGMPTPMVTSAVLTVSAPKAGDGLSDLDRLRRAVRDALGHEKIELPPDILVTLPRVLRERNGIAEIRYFLNNDLLRVVSLTSDCRENYGVAVDIGTTTVAAHLVSLGSGTILASKTAYNAQIECGLDIISRINYARDDDRLYELKSKILGTVNSLIGDMAARTGISPGDVTAVSLAGNTTMTHLFMGIYPEHIRLYPYTPAIFDAPVYAARELGLDVCAHAPVFISPAVGSYVGGDVISGLLCTRMACAMPDDGLALFIDIGTNGEIVLGNGDFLLSCACSAGPAFEGGGIRHGCRASAGAIERVELDGNKVNCSTIGGAPPVGICGSGIISLVAELFKKGFIDAAGRFTGKSPLVTVDGRKCFLVASNDDIQITISEADIDNFIRAKAAVFSACQTLLDNVGLSFEDLDRIYVAGGFGRFLDMDAAASVGLLPRVRKKGKENGEPITFLGNASLSGAYMTLISETHRNRLHETAKRITYIDLSAEPGYMDAYMAALFLPHTTLELF